jgi:hypothetical protein
MPRDRTTTWRQAGHLYLWQYRENSRRYAGWHLTADDAACVSLLDLLDRLEQLSDCVLAVTRPTAQVLAVPNFPPLVHWSAPKVLRLIFSREEAWDIRSVAEEVTLMLGPAMLGELRNGIAGIPQGKGDYAIRPSNVEPDQELWLWWMVRQ